MADAPAPTSPPIPLRAPPPPGEPVLEGDVVLNIAGEAVAFHLEAPDGPTTLEALLPIFQGLASEVARRAAAKAIDGGRKISCRAGCGACCRQAVPVSEAEAHRIAELVEAMPEPRRSAVRARFEAAEAQLEETSLASRVLDMPDGKTVVDVGTKYFFLGLPCPFLEAESCSIHPDRPLRCREYFVTSPAAACVAMVDGTIDRVPLPGIPSKALYAANTDKTPQGWVLLTQALTFSRLFPDPSPARPAPEWLADVVGRLAAE
ncbi:MAG TPA: YkgJ family cysteine cluster protein [Caulobacteraceae bacterium]|nr:YkgJ family cysteine cluster protein [Caulobacteraceae bacterium]